MKAGGRTPVRLCYPRVSACLPLSCLGSTQLPEPRHNLVESRFLVWSHLHCTACLLLRPLSLASRYSNLNRIPSHRPYSSPHSSSRSRSTVTVSSRRFLPSSSSPSIVASLDQDFATSLDSAQTAVLAKASTRATSTTGSTSCCRHPQDLNCPSVVLQDNQTVNKKASFAPLEPC